MNNGAGLDARNWVPDPYFADGHHLTPEGADMFTRRLDQEVLQYLGSGQSPPIFGLNLAVRPQRHGN